MSPRMSEWSFPEAAQRKANFTKVSLLSLGRRLWNKTKQSYKHRSALSRGAPLIKYFQRSYSSLLTPREHPVLAKVTSFKVKNLSYKSQSYFPISQVFPLGSTNFPDPGPREHRFSTGTRANTQANKQTNKRVREGKKGREMLGKVEKVPCFVFLKWSIM